MATSYNCGLPLRFGSCALARSATHRLSVTRLHTQATCQSLTSLRDSGSAYIGKPITLYEIAGREEKVYFALKDFVLALDKKRN